MNWLGLDIGGANIKIADGRSYGRSIGFPLWQKPHELSGILAELISSAPSSNGVVVTMTGELADCFETKRMGVLHILNAVEQAANSRSVAVYLVDGGLVSLSAARTHPLLAAASNWHALACFACRLIDEFPALLIDIGTTTTDVIPLDESGPTTTSQTDTERLLRGELVYMGIGRTPVAAIAARIPFRGEQCPVAAERFATSADAAILLDILPEQPEERSTADGRPLTKRYSRDRMARMICADHNTFSEADARQAAQFIWKRQTQRVREAIEHVINRMPALPRTILLSGCGETLARDAVAILSLDMQVQNLSNLHLLESHISTVAPAHAVAVLMREINKQ